MSRSARIQRLTQLALIGVFLTVISAPLAGRLLALEDAFAVTENRRPAPFPELELRGWSIASFPIRFERYWNDSFAFRRMLIRGHSVGKLHLGVSPSSKVLVGRDGHLFYAADQSLEYYRRSKPFTSEGLARWERDLEARRHWVVEQGIRYLVVIAPNKETIYPEYMPPTVRPVRPASRQDQLLEYLRVHSAVDVLDLRPTLVDGKGRGHLYHRTDSHWNDLGAELAARAILARLREWFPAINAPPGPVEVRVRPGAGGDLARMI